MASSESERCLESFMRIHVNQEYAMCIGIWAKLHMGKHL